MNDRNYLVNRDNVFWGILYNIEVVNGRKRFVSERYILFSKDSDGKGRDLLYRDLNDEGYNIYDDYSGLRAKDFNEGDKIILRPIQLDSSLLLYGYPEVLSYADIRDYASKKEFDPDAFIRFIIEAGASNKIDLLPGMIWLFFQKTKNPYKQPRSTKVKVKKL